MAEEMKNLNKEIIRYYDECEIDYWLIWRNRKNLATHYGFWERGIKTQNSALLNFNKVLAQRVKLESTDVVLDAGCGLGGSSIWLAKNYGCKAVGINIFEKQLNTARKYAKKYGVNKLTRFVLADFARTGFKPGTFDVVWGLESICYAENKKNFAREAHRILRKGGRLIIADGFAKKEHMKPEEEELLNKK